MALDSEEMLRQAQERLRQTEERLAKARKEVEETRITARSTDNMITVVVDGKVEARPTLYISVAYDHRVIDGATGARFTTALKAALQAPA